MAPPDLALIRRFSLALALILLVYSFTGIDIDTTKELKFLDVPISLKQPKLIPWALILATFYGAFQYNDQNSLGQDAYSLVNLRVAATTKLVFLEFLVRNAFDTKYIPLAFPYPSFAPSGFMGEMGAPRTVTFTAGVRF